MFSFFEFVFILLALLFCLHVCLCENAELPELQLQTVVSWELHLGPPEEQQPVLTNEPCLQDGERFLEQQNPDRISKDRYTTPAGSDFNSLKADSL